jgi:hypothetical protein
MGEEATTMSARLVILIMSLMISFDSYAQIESIHIDICQVPCERVVQELLVQCHVLFHTLRNCRLGDQYGLIE